MSNHRRMFVSITKTGESLQQRDLLILSELILFGKTV